jgi:transcriptional regulator with XRE-family HTH domain
VGALSDVWVRINGQRDLRENLRSAIKAAGMTQDAAAKQAGVSYTRLTAGLAGNRWFERDEVLAFARVLQIAPAKLMGGSIFRNQRDRYVEFDHSPSELVEDSQQRAEQQQKEDEERERASRRGRTRAICCVCGSLRTCRGDRYRWEPSLAEGGYRPRDGHRVTEELKCFECKTVTTHAVLLLSDERDAAEVADRRPSRSALALGERDRLIERLREFNVVVNYRPGYHSTKPGKTETFYSSGYEFNSNTMQWEIFLDENMPPRLQVTMLESHWAKIASGDHPGVDWDPKDGVGISPTTTAWEMAADDLMKDVQRFLDVERTRMVLEIREEYADAADEKGMQILQTPGEDQR